VRQAHRCEGCATAREKHIKEISDLQAAEDAEHKRWREEQARIDAEARARLEAEEVEQERIMTLRREARRKILDNQMREFREWTAKQMDAKCPRPSGTRPRPKRAPRD
jgi:hypothetical protein